MKKIIIKSGFGDKIASKTKLDAILKVVYIEQQQARKSRSRKLCATFLHLWSYLDTSILQFM